jgi:hypothetical protein
MTMEIRQASPHLSAGAGRGIARMDGTGKLNNKIALISAEPPARSCDRHALPGRGRQARCQRPASLLQT